MRARRLAASLLRESGIGVALLALCVVFAALAPRFASIPNLTNILTQISINTIIAVGMTFVVLLGGIDLSVGSVLALATVVGGKVMTSTLLPPAVGIPAGIAAALAIATACGLVNGAITSRFRVHSFIVTLGMLNVARGAALQVTQSRTIHEFPPAFTGLGEASLVGVPLVFVVALVFVGAGWLLLNRTVFGRLVLAIGGNEEAVRLAGHAPSVYQVAAFALCGLSVGVAAVLYMIRLSIASPILGGGFELNAIAAVVLGGTSLAGGRGSIEGTFLGACIMGVLGNGLLLLGVGDFARQMITGLIIVGAVILDRYRARFLERLETS